MPAMPRTAAQASSDKLQIRLHQQPCRTLLKNLAPVGQISWDFILSRLDVPPNDAARNDTYKRFRILINGNSFCQAVSTAEFLASETDP